MGSPRALLKKIKSKKSVIGTIRLRRKKSKATAGAAEAHHDNVDDQAWEYQVTSTPIDCLHEQPRGYFDWLTHKVKELSGAGAGAGADVTTCDAAISNAEETYTNQYSSDYGWSWLSSCWGHEAVLDKVDDTTDDTSTTEEDSTLQSSQDSTDGSDGTGESSVPSLSRVDQVLKLTLNADDEVSDITSVPSIDETLSDSESEDLSQL